DPRRMHLEVDVGRATRIGDRPYRSEGVAAAAIDIAAAIALECRIAPALAGVAGMIVDAICVALPDLDHRTAHDVAALVKHSSGDVRDMAHGLRRLSLYPHQIRVGVGRKRRHWIERPLGLTRCDDQRRLSKYNLRSDERSTCCDENFAAI